MQAFSSCFPQCFFSFCTFFGFPAMLPKVLPYPSLQMPHIRLARFSQSPAAGVDMPQSQRIQIYLAGPGSLLPGHLFLYSFFSGFRKPLVFFSTSRLVTMTIWPQPRHFSRKSAPTLRISHSWLPQGWGFFNLTISPTSYSIGSLPMFPGETAVTALPRLLLPESSAPARPLLPERRPDSGFSTFHFPFSTYKKGD